VGCKEDTILRQKVVRKVTDPQKLKAIAIFLWWIAFGFAMTHNLPASILIGVWGFGMHETAYPVRVNRIIESGVFYERIG
jgi:hypothetical protein